MNFKEINELRVCRDELKEIRRNRTEEQAELFNCINIYHIAVVAFMFILKGC